MTQSTITGGGIDDGGGVTVMVGIGVPVIVLVEAAVVAEGAGNCVAAITISRMGDDVIDGYAPSPK